MNSLFSFFAKNSYSFMKIKLSVDLKEDKMINWERRFKMLCEQIDKEIEFANDERLNECTTDDFIRGMKFAYECIKMTSEHLNNGDYDDLLND